MVQNDILISIIIPCFNCKDWLNQVFNSLINQKYKNFEVIFIDDGSKDDSYFIAKTILEESKLNYKIIRQENLGVSVARNYAINQAIGEYIYFLDCDDYISIDFSETIKNINNNKDMIFFNYSKVKEGQVVKEIKNSFCGEQSNNEILKKLLDDKFKYHMCSFLVKRELVNKYQIRFTVGCRYGEDHEFIIKCICNSNKILVINNILFYYCMRESSAVHKYNENRLDSITAAIRVDRYVNSIMDNFDIKEMSKKFVANKIIYNLREFVTITKLSKESNKVKILLMQMLDENFNYIKYLNYRERTNIKKIIVKMLLRINYNLYFILIKKYNTLRGIYEKNIS